MSAFTLLQTLAWFHGRQAGYPIGGSMPLAKAVESAGYHSFIVPDSICYPKACDTKYPYTSEGERQFLEDRPFIEPFSIIPAMGVVTKRLRFVTFVAKLPVRQPVLVAKSATSVAVLTNNRFGFGIGLGTWTEDFQVCGQEWKTRGKRMDEMNCGQNAVCTHIGNELFASFHTTDSKSRLNFLQLLCQPEERYTLNEEMRFCLELLGAPQKLQQRVAALREETFTGHEAFCKQLGRWRIKSEKHRTLVCEAALYGTLLTERWYDDLALVSDDAPQFKLFGFVHGLCWVHAERKVSRLIPLTPKHKQVVEHVRDHIWKFYEQLKA